MVPAEPARATALGAAAHPGPRVAAADVDLPPLLRGGGRDRVSVALADGVVANTINRVPSAGDARSASGERGVADQLCAIRGHVPKMRVAGDSA